MAIFARNPTTLWLICGVVSLLAAGILAMGGRSEVRIKNDE
jgi:hypothetical protein